MDDVERQLADEFSRATSAVSHEDAPGFPGGTWLTAGLALLWWQSGDMIPGLLRAWLQTKSWILYIALALMAVALLRSVLWAMKRGKPLVDKEFVSATARSRELQAVKRDLLAQLQELQK
ncbi:hypothetical protein CVU37_14585 [candidate division BRC1 bacterium HGW-BRC1-1]|nr:MAG: hypothetical protein CVU37_14585 [candidate division BRC1 bacterium HGW-BRC1-1]